MIITLTGTGIYATDTANLTRAFAEATTDTSKRHIVLEGMFKTLTTHQIPPCTIVEGAGASIITYSGPRTSQPVLSVQGTGSRLSNLHIYCQKKSRGIKFTNCTYGEICHRMRVYDTVELGVNFERCWAGHVDDLMVVGTNGISTRHYQCNSASYNRVRIVDNTLGDVWPAEIPADERACMVLLGDQDLCSFTNLIFEPVECGDYPAISCRSSVSRFAHVRFENCRFRDAMIRVHGNGCREGTCLTFEDIWIYNPTPAKFFAKLTGTTKHIRVDNVFHNASSVTEGVVRAVGTKHSDLAVSRIYTHEPNALPLIVYD